MPWIEGCSHPWEIDLFLYALFDGLFQRCLLRHLSGDRKAIADLRKEVERLLPTVA